MDQVEDGTPRYEAIVEELDYTDEENKHKPCQSMQNLWDTVTRKMNHA